MIAALLCASMTLAGCSNNNNSGTGSTASVSAKDKRPEKFTLRTSTDIGNAGEVTLKSGDIYAVISVKDFGDIKIKLFPELAPYSVYNFTELAKRGDYNGRNFHRLVENFMIQGGSGNGVGSGGDSFDGGSFKNEVNTSLRHYYGALCYAASGLGDITDGFYIVNSKEPVTDVSGTYDAAYSSFNGYAQYYGAIASGYDKDDPNYNMILGLATYNSNAAQCVQVMKDSLTDDIIKTYAEKGGKPALDGAYTVFGQTVEGFDVIDKITAVEKEDDGSGNISKPVKSIIIDKVEIFTMQ